MDHIHIDSTYVVNLLLTLRRSSLIMLFSFSFTMLEMVPYCIILQDVYFDDESAEVVLSSLRLGDDRER